MKCSPIILLVSITSWVHAQQLLTSQLSGQSNTAIATAVPFLLISPDARASGLGDAGCASSPDVYSNYWNASKNVFAEKENGISFSWTPWLRALVPDINLFDLSIYTKVGKKNAVGFSERYFSEGDISFINVVGGSLSQFHPYEHSESIFFSHKLKHNFSVGIAGKYIYSNLTGNNQTAGEAFAMDASCYKRDTIKIIKSDDVFAWGINISNVGQEIYYSQNGQKEFLPTNFRLGISYKVNMDTRNSIELICDANRLLIPMPTFNNSFKEQLSTINIASGIEYWYDKAFALRTGYFYEDPQMGRRKYFTFGLGVRYTIFELDFSYLIPIEQRNPLQNTLRFTLSCAFDKKNMKANKSSHFVD